MEYYVVFQYYDVAVVQLHNFVDFSAVIMGPGHQTSQTGWNQASLLPQLARNQNWNFVSGFQFRQELNAVLNLESDGSFFQDSPLIMYECLHHYDFFSQLQYTKRDLIRRRPIGQLKSSSSLRSKKAAFQSDQIFFLL